jgi:hypothetical protein
MAQRLEFARPVMRRRTGLDPDEACWQPLKETQDMPASQLATDDHLAFRINAVHLEH